MAITEFTLSPEYEYQQDQTYNTIRTPFDLGYVQATARWPKVKRRFFLQWTTATQADKDYADSFVKEAKGSADTFPFTPKDPVSAPVNPGDATQVAGGSLTSRTYYYAITWETAAGETTASPERSIALSANFLFRITIPALPTNVSNAKLYVSETSGALEFQTDISMAFGSWTEPSSGLISGANPPASNTADETVTVRVAEDAFTWRKVTAALYAMALVFEEEF